jgi:glyoxylase-like metal-dependent hydrolase (beta-lactamase superfamily II)
MTIDFHAGAPVPGSLDVAWIHGSPRGQPNGDPPIQAHSYDPHTTILRQNRAISPEAPFLYLLFGNDRALLLDTGATEDAGRFPLRETVDGLVDAWLAAHPRDAYELVVAHTHAHGDHVAGDAQFADRPDTTLVGTGIDDVQSFFGFASWPEETVRLDLGGRVVEIIGIPGHHETSIALYDPWTGFLLSGDTAYPGRLYARDMPAFVASLERMVEFAATRTVSHVMGCHIEMTRTPNRDYPLGSAFQPDEPPLEMSVEALAAIRDAARSVADRPGVHPFGDFILYVGSARWGVIKLIARSLASKLLGRSGSK